MVAIATVAIIIVTHHGQLLGLSFVLSSAFGLVFRSFVVVDGDGV
jgi:hypothetical protein